MKSFLNLLLILAAPAFFSCNNASKEETGKIDSNTINSTTTADTPNTEAAFVPFLMMLIKHKVANYSKWKSAYEEHGSVRKEYGLTDMGLSAAAEDENTILIAEKITDIQKAKDFTALPDLKDLMTKAGVVSKPEFSYFNVIRRDDSKIDTKDRVTVTHRVKDFDAWLKAYDGEGKTTRASEGMVDRMLARGVDDPNVVFISFAITDMGKAKSAIFSEAKKNLMMSAGVEGVPVIEFYKRLD
jgi:hypothetical protein